MATVDTNTFQSSANLSFWYKNYTSEALTLADVPEIIPSRWIYFRDNWQLLKKRLISIASTTTDPDYFTFAINNLTDFINKQRNNTTDVNPFASNSIYYRFYPVFDNILVEQIALTNEERAIIKNKKQSIALYSKNDFIKIKNTIRAYRDEIADLNGLSDPDYNRIYNRATPISAQVTPSLADLTLMLLLEQNLKSVNFILANLFTIDTAFDPFVLARQNANNPDIDIGQYSDGTLVKLNYKEDLQDLATRYLKDPNKWLDIAIANGLKEPYIDEVGTQLFLLSNGSGNQVNIAMLDQHGNPNISKFNINQLILIQSNAFPFSSQRIVTNIKEIPVSGEIILTLSGDLNLNQYLLSDQASIRVFAPNTINSSQYILIPSLLPLTNKRQEEIPWFMTSSAADEKNTKIDFAISDSGNLLLTPNGDIALSYGLANGIQAIKLKMLTELGSNRYHPTFGLVNLVGARNADPDGIKALLTNSIATQIQSDSRFDRLETLSVQFSKSGAVAVIINLTVRLAGGSSVVPISFAIAR